MINYCVNTQFKYWGIRHTKDRKKLALFLAPIVELVNRLGSTIKLILIYHLSVSLKSLAFGWIKFSSTIP